MRIGSAFARYLSVPRCPAPAILQLALLCGLVGSALLAPVAAGAAEEDVWDVAHPPYSVSAKPVEIDVTEGTWMSLDVSPDGKSIVFDLLGDIYQMPLEGGEARSLTRGHAWDMQPRFSPDGKRIAFTSDRAGGDNIWIMELASGELRQITHESFRLLNNPSWSPDGDYIAARKHFTTSRSLGTGEIWLYHTRGGDQQQGQAVVERPGESFQKEQGEPAFAPDGSAIYFTLNTTPGDTFIYHQDSNGEIFQIRKIDLADGEIDTVVGGPGGAVRPTPSPDGKQLAYVKRVRAASRLFVMDLASGEERMVYDALDQDMQETWAVHGLYPNMAWTPDSRQLVFWAGGKLWKIDLASTQVTAIPFHVSDQRDVYPAPRFTVDVAPQRFDTRMVRGASQAPDGSAIVFESLGRLYIKRGDAAPAVLSADPGQGFDYEPVWAPDRRSVYFLRWNDQALSTLHRVAATGGRSATLPLERGQYTGLAVAPDGKTLALQKRPGDPLLHPEWGQRPGLYTLDLASGAARFVSERGSDPHFGPDDRLYAQERAQSATGRDSDTASTTLISMTRDGHDVRELASAGDASAIRLAPDGRHIAFIRGFQVNVADVTPSGKPLVLDADKPAFPTTQVSRVGGTYLHWSADGRALGWSTGPTLHSVTVEEAMAEDYAGPADGTNLSISVAYSVPETRLALTNARIVTMNGAREVIEEGTLLVRGNRILKLGPVTQVPIPDGFQVVDLAGKTLIPGLWIFTRTVPTATARSSRSRTGTCSPTWRWVSPLCTIPPVRQTWHLLRPSTPGRAAFSARASFLQAKSCTALTAPTSRR